MPAVPSFAGFLAACVDLTSNAGHGLLAVLSQLPGQDDDVRWKTTISALLVLPALALALVVVRWRLRSPRSTGFARLRPKPAGAGKQGNNWEKDGTGQGGVSEGVDVQVKVTWISWRELRVLQAIGDTLLPGFEIGTKERADAVVEQVT